MSENQKGTSLEGEGSMTDEVFASSKSILTPGSYGTGQKGLQQFYSPEALAKIVKRIMGDRICVLDPTAGDGMLLSEIDNTRSFGIEIDSDQIKNSKEEGRGYNAIKGDLQHVYPLIRKGFNSFPGIVANPPFGLMWQDATYRGGKPTNSAELTWFYLHQMLSEDGQFIFVDGANHFDQKIMGKELVGTKGVYAIIEIDDLFENTNHPCIIAFGTHEECRSASHEGASRRKFTLDTLDLAGDWLTEKRSDACGRYGNWATSTWASHTWADDWKVIQTEYDRRLEGRTKKNREYDALLVGSSKIQWLPSAYAQMALAKESDSRAFQGLNGQPVNYFAQNERLWNKLLGYQAAGILTVDPKLDAAVEAVLGVLRKERVPLYEVKPAQRLGFLTDVEFLECIKDDPTNRFMAGEHYRLDTRTQTNIETEKRVVESKKNPGEYEEKTFEKQKKVLKISIGHHSIYDGGNTASSDIKWLLNHFKLPDPGDVATRHPEEILRLENLVRETMTEMMAHSAVWEAKHKIGMPFTIREFQVKDIARMLFKGGGLLSWEQGLGKTAGGIAFYLACVKEGAQDALLVVTANDLIDQWKREFKRFTGKEPVLIKTHGQAKRIANELRLGGTGVYIAHYGTLSLAGTKGKNLLLPPVVVKEWQEPRKIKGTGKWGYAQYRDEAGSLITKEQACEIGKALLLEQGRDESYDYYQLNAAIRGKKVSLLPCNYGDEGCVNTSIPEQYEQITKTITSKELCPQCQADTKSGWNGAYCEAEDAKGSKCGYSHYAVKVKPIASLLSTAFNRGIGIYDEIQMIQARAAGNDSKRSRAMRGLSFKHFLGMTGTPIKNYIDQAFWPLWKSLGNGSVRFPYSYESGPISFESDFSVIEFVKNGGRRENRKALPEVTNLSLLWRILASSIIRRRKEETGEPLVDKFYHEIKVPLGLAQAEQFASWLKNFPALFKEKYPEHAIVKAGMHEILAPTLGLNWKLDYAMTLPLGDPDAEWTGVEGLSNFTPANLRVLELTMALVSQGKKVLIGSNLKNTSGWVAERLCEKGVKAVHILDEDGNTVNADTRAKHVYSFQTDDVDVFCAGTKAIRLGHNLDAAQAVILHGLDFDYEGLEQFVARIHRLTSAQPVDIFVILPTLDEQQTITTRKWDLLEMKGGAAELALDGRLIQKNEQMISETEVIRELMARGFDVTEEAVEESIMEDVWLDTPQIDDFVILDGMIPPRPKIEKPVMTPHAFHVMTVVGNFLTAAYDSIQAIDYSTEWVEALAEYAEILRKLDSIEEMGDTVMLALHTADPETEYRNAWADAIIEDSERFPIDGQIDFIVALGEDETEPEVLFGNPPAVVLDDLFVPNDPEIVAELLSNDAGEEEWIPVETKPLIQTVDPMTEFLSEMKSLGELHGLGILDDDEFAWAKKVSKEKLEIVVGKARS